MTPAEILRAAATTVRRGWCQGNDWDRGRFCALGAMRVCQPNYFKYEAALDQLSSSLGFKSGVDVILWNDTLGQTSENVAAAMEYAALLWEQEQAQSSPATTASLQETA